MDWSILIGASQLAAGLVALWLLSFVLLLVVRFALCAEKWDGFITLQEWYKKGCYEYRIIIERGFLKSLSAEDVQQFPYAVRVQSVPYVVQAFCSGGSWVIRGRELRPSGVSTNVSYIDPAGATGSRAYAWISLENLYTKFETKQECIDAIKTLPCCGKTYDKYKIDDDVEEKTVPYAVLTLPALVLAALADLFLYAFFLSPVVTLSVSGIVLTIACSRFLSSKLADNIKKTKENSDDIEDLKSSKKDEG